MEVSGLCPWDQHVLLELRVSEFISWEGFMSCGQGPPAILCAQPGSGRPWSPDRYSQGSMAVCCRGNTRRGGQARQKQLTVFLPPHSVM